VGALLDDRPCSSTTIRPAWRIVDRRWAITIAVRPATRRRRPCSISVSVWTSTLEVASSSTRIRGSATSARANATAGAGRPRAGRRARRPGCRSRGRARDERRRRRPRAPRRDLGVGGVGSPEGDVLAHGAAEQEALLGHDPHLRAQRAGVTSRRSWPSTSTRPRSGRRSGSTSLASVDLPAPVAPTSATVWPAGIVRSTSRSAQAASSSSGHTGTRRGRSRSSPRIRGSSTASGGVDEIRLLVEQLEDLVERRHPRLVGRVELRELLDRVEEVVQRRDEREHDAGRGVAVDRLDPADHARISTVTSADSSSTSGK
jgi:hypothetical protein